MYLSGGPKLLYVNMTEKLLLSTLRAQKRHAGGCVRDSVTQEEEEEVVIEAVT